MPQPTLVLIDIQKEYFTKGRPFYLNGGADSLENARTLLALARKNNWNIIHVQHLNDGEYFPRGGETSQFVEGFEPQENEDLVVKSALSAYSNPQFKDLIEANKQQEIYVVGYGSTMCCLATIITGVSNGHKLTFVKDASWAKKPNDALEERPTHEVMSAVLAIHSKVTTTQEIIDKV